MYSNIGEHSPEDGKSFQVLVMCKTHVKVSFKTVMDLAPIFWCRRESKAELEEGSSRTRHNKKGNRISRLRECWWSQLGVGHICSLPDS